MIKWKSVRKLMAMALSIIMVVASTSISALAEEGTLYYDTSDESTGYKMLADDSKLVSVDTVSGSAIGIDIVTGSAIEADTASGSAIEVDTASGSAISIDTVSGSAIKVDALAITGRITAFEELPDDIRWQNTTSPIFPDTVRGIIEDEMVDIPVTWTTKQEYNEAYPVRGLYVFTAVMDDEYTLEDHVYSPTITVFIPQTVGLRMALMAGSGTSASPIEITTAQQLREIAVLVNADRLELFLFNNPDEKAYFKLMSDIDLSVYGRDFNSGKGWVPIGTSKYFKGELDGNGHTIYGLYINDDRLNGVGFFSGITNATIKNLNFANVYVNGNMYVGGIAGSVNSDAVITNCTISGTVRGLGIVGGITGWLSGQMSYCYADCNIYCVEGDNSGSGFGGMVGFLRDGVLKYCYTTGTVTGKYLAGGIVGEIDYINTGDKTNIQACIALNSKVEGIGDTVGCVAGRNRGSASLIYYYKGMDCDSRGYAHLDGYALDADDLQNDFPYAFTISPWTYQYGKLPGLFGKAIDMPLYLLENTDIPFNGSGTEGSPYLIDTAEQLYWLATSINDGSIFSTDLSDKYYRLTSNIDLTAYGAGWDEGKGWNPIGGGTFNGFEGHFDGGGHTITGLYINRPDQSNVGLFRRIDDGTVENLGLIGVDITGSSNVGGLVGYLHDDGNLYNSARATIRNCYTTGMIRGSSRTGGIAGSVKSESYQNCTISNCYSTATIIGSSYTGGIAGNLGFGIIRNSYSIGAISGTSSVGGIAGLVDTAGQISDCAALNISVSGTGNIGRIFGSSETSISSGNFAFAGMTVTIGGTVQTITDGSAANKNGVDKTALELKTAAGFPSALASTPWNYMPNSLPVLTDGQGRLLQGQNRAMPQHIGGGSYFSTGDGSPESPYIIEIPSQLAKLAELVNDNNPAYNNKHYRLHNDIDLSEYQSNGGWIPIGKQGSPFRGSFDGNGKVVTNLYINRMNNTDYYHGLFGFLQNATVKSLGLTGVNISGFYYAGGVAGQANNSLMQNCYVTGYVGGYGYTGGIAGSLSGSTIQSCYVDGQISAIKNVGGIAGTVESGTVQDCYTLGSILTEIYGENTGGIVGYTKGLVINCYTSSTVYGGNYVGGIAGRAYNDGVLNRCVVLSSSVTAYHQQVRRVVASKEPAAVLISNYVYSNVTGGGNDKISSGLDGENLSVEQIHSSDFWQSTLSWDSTAVWSITDGKLPVLKNTGGLQLGEGGLLIERDLTRASIVLDSDSYVYTGSQIQPVITVSFAGQTLIRDFDYTTSIISSDTGGTSSGINAGTVTLKIEGKGNFKGLQTKSFNIVKATPTKDHLQYVNSVTYSGSAQSADVTPKVGLSGLGDITVKYNGSTTVPVNAGEYTITVDIGEGSNFNATTGSIELGTFTIHKAAGVFPSVDPVLIIYTPTLKLEDITLPADYDWSSPDTPLYAGDGQIHQAIYIHLSGNYEAASGYITVNVAKASPSLLLTADPAGTCLRPGSVTLTIYLPADATGTLTFREGANIISTVTLPDKTATFTPSGADNDFKFTVEYSGDSNYESDLSNEISYFFIKSEQDNIVTSDAVINYGESLNLSTLVSGGSGTGAFSFTLKDGPGEINDDVILTPTGTGEIAITVTKAGDDDYQVKSADFMITVNPRIITFAVAYVKNQEYTGKHITPTPEVKDGDYVLTEGVHYYYTYDNNMAAGGMAIIYVNGIGNYAGSTGSTSFIIKMIPVITATAYDEPTTPHNQPTSSSINVTAQVSDGIASLTITDSMVNEAIETALADSKENGTTKNGISVDISISASDATEFKFVIERTTLGHLLKAGVKSFSLSGLPVNISFDAAAIRKLQSKSGDNLTITISPVTVTDLQSAFDITFSTKMGKKTVNITSLGKGTSILSISVNPGENELNGYLYGAYMGEDGQIIRIDNSYYDASNKRLILSVDHFSVYGVGYTAPETELIDIKNHWAKDSINYIIGRELLSGTSETTFGPDKALTRGMLVTALGRLAGVDVEEYTGNRFKDIKPDNVLQPYAEWAYKKGIISNINKGLFKPNRLITREELAVIITSFANATGYKLPVTREVSTYVDAYTIDSSCISAVMSMRQAGIMIGASGNRFNPKSYVTRAEACLILNRYIRLTINPVTAQGWELNDTGQYLFYRDGKALTGWHNIDDTWYYFNYDGSLVKKY